MMTEFIFGGIFSIAVFIFGIVVGAALQLGIARKNNNPFIDPPHPSDRRDEN